MLLAKIKDLCKARGVSISRLEREVGIGNGTIDDWDHSNPRVDKLKAVADYFGVTVDYLLED